MHFKSLELIGFKSFGEKTKLNFEPGVTAVVGPNGCGKSNIADSIRWVLGEQSAKSLRASNMQDVIFNGTETKEPINFAEVSLTFSNDDRTLPIDYNEVTITRRVFRSGDTEYLLNKTPVRLKDIHELLMGTGLGTESYSIIEQGKMDLILSSKPEDRRFVFEEASGITKYKTRKKEAMRKLEQTEQNLLRINDIIIEVKRQISSIERQARKAEKYKTDFDRLKDMEIKISFADFKSLKTQEKTFLVESNDVHSLEADLSAEIGAMADRIGDYRHSLDDVNLKISELRGTFMERSNSLDMNVQKAGFNEERIKETKDFQEGLKKEIAVTREKVQSLKGVVEKLKQDLANVSAGRTEKEKVLKEKDQLFTVLSQGIVESESRINNCKTQLVDSIAKETHIKNELIKMGADVQNKRIRQRRLTVEREATVKELQAIEQALVNVLGEFSAIEGRVAGLRLDIDAKRQAHESILAEKRTIEESLGKLESQKASLASKIELLEESIRRYEGYNAGVKNLLVKREGDGSALPGMRGVLADLITVDQGYEEAVATVLGDHAQLIVADTNKDVASMIEYLASNGLGKASFVSLEMLAAAGGSSRASDNPSGAASLTQFVKIREGYEAVLRHLFGHTYVVDSLDDIFRAAGMHDEVVYVTKAGQMRTRGLVWGGAAGESAVTSLIGRRERLEGLKRELASTEETHAKLAGTKAEKEAHDRTLAVEIRALEDAAHVEEIGLSNIKVKKDAQTENAGKMKDELGLLDSELEDVNQSIDELTKNGETLNAELNKIEAEKGAAQVAMDEASAAIVAKRSEKETVALEIATVRTEAQALVKDEDGMRIVLKNQEALVFEFEEAVYVKESLLAESGNKIVALQEEIVRLNAQNGEIRTLLESLTGEISGIDATKVEIVDKLSVDEARLKEKDGELEKLRNQARDLDVKLTELSYRKNNLRDRIVQAYKFDIENEHVEIEDSIDWDSIRSQVSELKARLESLGPVNLVAIEEHKELEERYAFLTRQQEDLVSAKDSLMKAIQKINKTTKELFIDTFQKIQVEFKNFFRMLFGGGQAELVLIDEQDVLESGIEIVARPPGKKLQNIMLLSGGEKALTATALLFSIFKVKPSPFCVLDEIDAPLDESNIRRFASVLKDFIRMSQFIIITHNKRTIELADVMYGITMQERGISKIVSVKFMDETKAKEAAAAAAAEKDSDGGSVLVDRVEVPVDDEAVMPAEGVPSVSPEQPAMEAALEPIASESGTLQNDQKDPATTEDPSR